MIPPEDISARLPEPRDDEPPELRRDIADELADHLHCSMTRERLSDDTGPSRSEEEIIEAALERFGDPGQIARRLWWDAMKEKIMAQRFLMALALSAAVACLVSVAVLVWLVGISREAQSALLAEQRAWMEAMIAELRAPRDSEKTTAQFGDWQPLRVKLVDEQGAAVQGNVHCFGTPYQQTNPLMQEIHTDAGGSVDFGRLPPGSYTLTAAVDSTHESSSGSNVLVGPGRPAETIIRCPTKWEASVPARFKIDPPASVPSDRLYFVAMLSRRGRIVDNKFWKADGEPISLLLDARGGVLGELPAGFVMPAVPMAGILGVSGTMYPPAVPQFGAEIPSSLPLAPAPEIIPSSYQVTISAYLAEAATADAATRPPLNLLAAAPLTISCKMTADAADDCRVGLGERTFWNSVGIQTTPEPPPEIYEVFDTPVEEPPDASPTHPTATPPGNSDPD